MAHTFSQTATASSPVFIIHFLERGTAINNYKKNLIRNKSSHWLHLKQEPLHTITVVITKKQKMHRHKILSLNKIINMWLLLRWDQKQCHNMHLCNNALKMKIFSSDFLVFDIFDVHFRINSNNPNQVHSPKSKVKKNNKQTSKHVFTSNK